MTRLTAALSIAVMCCTGVRAQTGPPAGDDLLGRAADYVRRFVADFSNVVADEDFRQDWQSGERRRLRSEFLLVRYPGASSTWLAFRDVVEVNGRAVRDQQERLTKLFLEPFGDALRRAEEITRAASRHSLVELGPLDSPLVILAWLQPYYQTQFVYRRGGIDSKLGARVRALELEEIVAPSVGGANVRVLPVRGVAWIDEETGRVVKTEVRAGLAPTTTIVTTRFAFDEALGIDVPAEMRQSRVRASAGRAATVRGDQFTGIATYSRFRRFQVRTDENIDTPLR